MSEREMTLKEYVNELPDGHLARMQFKAMARCIANIAESMIEFNTEVVQKDPAFQKMKAESGDKEPNWN